MFRALQGVKKGCQWQPFDSVSGEVNAPPLTCRKAFRFCPSQNRPIILLHFGTFMTGRSADYNIFRYVGYSEGDMAVPSFYVLGIARESDKAF